MVCKVCKRELDSPICSFCGEDNTPYMNVTEVESNAENADAIEQTDDIKSENTIDFKSDKIKESPVKTVKKVRKYKIDYLKLAKLLIIAAVIVAAILLISGLFKSDKKQTENQPEGRSLFSSQMLAAYSLGEWGYINLENPSVYAIAPQYRSVTDFKGGVAFAYIGGKYAMINKKGQLLTEPRFESVGNVADNGYAAVKADGKWGYVKSDATYAIEPKFTTASVFATNKTAAVSVNGAYGYIGEDGEYTIAPQFDMALDFSEDGYAAVKIGGKWGYISADGTTVIEPLFEEAHRFEDGYAVVKLYGDYGIINTKGEFVAEPQFDEYFTFDKNGRAKVKIGNKYGYADKKGKYIITPKFYDIGEFADSNLTYAQRGDGLYGFINADGEYKIEPQFEGAGNFSGGLAPVKIGGKWGYIDSEGTVIIEPAYATASMFYSEGYACVSDASGKYAIIDKQGVNILSSGTQIEKVLLK